MNVWCAQLVREGTALSRVRITPSADGSVATITPDTEPQPDDTILGLALPGIANGHSHAFHRLLRGRTHDHGGDFWVWRTQMYSAAAALDPERYRLLARAVFAEMLTAGYTAVGEFHYVHHRRDGAPYPYEMELAVAEAAADVGIRLTLLDTAYLSGGIGAPLSAEQTRFGDGTAEGYLARWHALSARIPGLGAALHSVRAVPPAAMQTIVAGLPDDIPLHIHLSEQVAENEAALAAYGVTPTRLLADLGVLSSRVSAVHATHLTEDDIALLSTSGGTAVMCPTTEADLGDGIGPARELLDGGVRIALGSDQNAVIDPFLEIRGLEMHERLRSQRRGRFTMPELGRAAGADGYRSLGLAAPLTPGGPLDLIEVDTDSVRTVGSAPEQITLSASAADVKTVIVGGRIVASAGLLADGRSPAELMAAACEEVR